MFESAELGHEVPKAQYDKEVPRLREELLALQLDVLEKAAFPIVILINGVPGAGRGETVNTLNEWMDPRHIQTHALDAPTDEERERPPMWRFWRVLPPKGKTGVFFGNWYTDPIVHRVIGETKDSDLEWSVEQITRFERMLANEGALLLKFWFHLSKKRQKKRLETLEKDPKTAWRVTKEDWERFRLYEPFTEVSARVLRETSTAYAPWMVVEGTDDRYRNLVVARAIRDAMKERLTDGKDVRKRGPTRALRATPKVDALNPLSALDLSQALSKPAYEKRIAGLERDLALLTRHKKFKKLPVVLAFEGMDAAGKGGTIRRVTRAIDARLYRVNPVAAPTEDERAQPYLWRFWRNLPRRGRIGIFDRSWYGRVLVERVEGYCSEFDWKRAYGEINDFEEDLVRFGTLVVKFWLHISEDEQLERFRERQKTGYKRFKITPEDWRNRKKWNAYVDAACEMFDRTSTEIAPWHLVAANDKYFARTEVLSTVVNELERALKKL